MRIRIHQGTVPLALALMGALLAAFAVMFSEDRRAEAITNCTVSHDALDSEEQAFLGLINDYRAQNGLGALTISTNLNRGSAWMVEDMATNAYFSHTDSLGRSPHARAIDCGYPAGAGENIAAGTNWSSAQSAFVAWQNSPGHNANMLGTFYQQIGIARFNLPGSPYNWYWATTFGATNDGTGGGGGAAPTNTPVPPTNTPQSTNTPLPTATPTQNQGGGGTLPTNTPTSIPTVTQAQPTTTGSPQFPATATPTKPATATPTKPASATPTKPATATPTAIPSSHSLPLSPGANLVAWPNGSASVAEVFGTSTSVSVVYEWDAATQTWKRYFPGLPTYLNNLQSMKQGGAYWIVAKTASSLVIDD